MHKESEAPDVDPLDDDGSWLLAVDTPRAIRAPTPSEPPVPVPPVQPSDTDLSPSSPPALSDWAGGRRSVWSLPSETVVAAPNAPWLAVGDAFQPLPGGPLLLPANGPQPAAVMLAVPGSSVHAVLPGVVHRSGAGLELRVNDGRVVGYRGESVVQWTAGDGEPVPAGAVLGWVAAASAPSGSEQNSEPLAKGPRNVAGSDPLATGVDPATATMVIYLVEANGVTVDPVKWLAGLPDPRELNLAGGVDPFRTDLRLSGLWDDPAGPGGAER